MTENDPEKRPSADDILRSSEMEHWGLEVEDKQ